jgi:hypothetical protein
MGSNERWRYPWISFLFCCFLQSNRSAGEMITNGIKPIWSENLSYDLPLRFNTFFLFKLHTVVRFVLCFNSASITKIFLMLSILLLMVGSMINDRLVRTVLIPFLPTKQIIFPQIRICFEFYKKSEIFFVHL